MTGAPVIVAAVVATILTATAIVGGGVTAVRLGRAKGRVARVEYFTTFCGWMVLLLAAGGISVHAWEQALT